MPVEILKGQLIEPHSEVGGAWGAAYAVATPISALVTGICCALAVEYFQEFPQDAPRIRGSVIVVVGTTVLGLLLAMDLTYLRLVENQTPPGGFGDIPWQDDAVALICGICQLICSAYFAKLSQPLSLNSCVTYVASYMILLASSAYSVATRKKTLVAWCGLLMTIIFLSAFFRAIIGLAPTDWFDGAVLCPKMTFLWLIGSLLLDFSIAVTILSHLRRPPPHGQSGAHVATPQVMRPGERRSSHPDPTRNFPPESGRPRAPLLGRLLTTILTSFSLTAILMFSLLLLVLAMHGTEFDPRLPKATGIFTALRLLATPTYAITFLYTLNRRKQKSSQPEHEAHSDFEMQLVTTSGAADWPPTFFTSLPATGKNGDGRNNIITMGWTSLRRHPFRRGSAPLPPPIHAADGQPDSIYHTKRPPYRFAYPTIKETIVSKF